MKFKIFQIALTDQEILEVNKGGSNRRNDLRRDMFGDRVVPNAKLALELGYYDHVMTVDAKNLEDVYAIGNFVHERDLDKVEVHGTFSSVSVGDVVVDENGRGFVVDIFGFQMLPEKLAA